MNTQKNLCLALLLGLFWAGQAMSQTFSKDVWHDGEIELFSGETLRGKLKYDLETNSLQVTLDGGLKSYSSFQVESFQFYDAVVKAPRSFYTLPYERSADYQSPVFFELLADGDALSLLTRENIVQRMTAPVGMWGWGMRPMGMSVPVVEDVFFVLDKDKEKVVKLAEAKDGLLGFMVGHTEEMEHYIKKNRLQLNQREGLVLAINHYNSLKKGGN
jgi:hypothetical protein